MQNSSPMGVSRSIHRGNGAIRSAMIRRELWLLRKEIERQDALDWSSHHRDCACWECIGRLQANVVQSYVRRRREL